MCEENSCTDSPGMGGVAYAGNAVADCNLKQACVPTLRDRLEAKRNRLSRELVEVEEALRLVYSDPNVERIHETLKRARV